MPGGSLRVFTPEILWHNQFSAILSVDAQPRSSHSDISQRIATAGVDKSVRVWSVTAGTTTAAGGPVFQFLSHLSFHQSAVNVVKFSHNGQYLASADDDGIVAVWQMDAAASTSAKDEPVTASQAQLAKGEAISAELDGNDDSVIDMGMTSTNSPPSKPSLPSPSANSESAPSALFGPDDSDLLSLSTERWSKFHCFKAHVSGCVALSWDPTSKFLATSSIDGQVSVWSVLERQLCVSVNAHDGFVQGCAWDPCGSLIATQSSDRSLCIFNINRHRNRMEHTAQIQSHKPITAADGSEKGSDGDGGDSEEGRKSDTSERNSSIIDDSNDDSVMALDPPPTKTPTPSPSPSSLPLFCDDTLLSFFRRPSFSHDGVFLIAPAGLRIDSDRGVNGKKSERIDVYCSYLFHRSSITQSPCLSLVHSEPSIASAWAPYYYQPPTDRSLCSLPYAQLFAIATTRSVYVYSTHEEAPIAVVSSIHLEALTDLVWLPSSSTKSDCVVDRLLVTSIDGYVTLIELHALLEPVDGDLERSIDQQFLQRCQQSLTIDSDGTATKSKRKRSRKSDSDEHDNDSELSQDANKLLTDAQRDELLSLQASGTRITVDFIKIKLEINKNKATKVFREIKVSLLEVTPARGKSERAGMKKLDTFFVKSDEGDAAGAAMEDDDAVIINQQDAKSTMLSTSQSSGDSHSEVASASEAVTILVTRSAAKAKTEPAANAKKKRKIAPTALSKSATKAVASVVSVQSTRTSSGGKRITAFLPVHPVARADSEIVEIVEKKFSQPVRDLDEEEMKETATVCEAIVRRAVTSAMRIVDSATKANARPKRKISPTLVK